MDEYFEENVYPVLTPMAVDASRPFPLIRNKTLNIGALVAEKGRKGYGNRVRNRTGSVCFAESCADSGGEGGGHRALRYCLLEEIIERNISKLFLNYNVSVRTSVSNYAKCRSCNR